MFRQMCRFVIVVLCRRLSPCSMILIVISSLITDVYYFVFIVDGLSLMALLKTLVYDFMWSSGDIIDSYYR